MRAPEYVPARHILIRNKSTQWFGTDHTMNLYRGCPHGCIYCDSRSQCYGDDDFDRVKVKERALELLRDELRRKVRPAFIGMGSMSDPYNPLERELELTRKALMLLHAYECGVAVCTKSGLILRDADLYADIQARAPVICKVTVTTTDEALAAKVEPGADSPAERLRALEGLAKRGIFTGVVMMPVLPFLEDSAANVLGVVDAAADAGARFVYPAFGMTLRDRQRAYYLDRVEGLFPGLGERYVRQYGTGYWCTSPRARELWAAFSQRCREKGLFYEMGQIVRAAKGTYDTQLTFFDME